MRNPLLITTALATAGLTVAGTPVFAQSAAPKRIQIGLSGSMEQWVGFAPQQ